MSLPDMIEWAEEHPDRAAVRIAELERENAALRAALASAEVGLKHALMMEPGDPFKRIAAITAALDAVRAACCSATGPSNDPEKLAHKIPAPL